jgi:glycosyltransferase involved in cell wall biosynthesis
MSAAKKKFDVSVIYWERSFFSQKSFFNDVAIKKYKVLSNKYGSYHINEIKRILILIKYMIKALRILRKINPKIVHCNNLDMLFIAVFFKVIFNKRMKIIYEIADLNKLTYNDSHLLIATVISLTMMNIEKILCKKISKLIITSPYFWSEYYKYFVTKNNTIFIPNAPSRKIFKNISDHPNKILTIGFIGSVRYKEQLKMLINVGEDLKNIRIFIAGKGPDYNEISSISKNLNFINMYGAYEYEKEIVKLYSMVDIVYSVYGTKYKNVKVALPNKLYEAIVSIKPIIVAKNTKLADFVIKKGIGFSVDDSDPNDLKNLLTNILNNKINLNNYKKNIKKIKDKYYSELYDKIILNMYIECIK